MPFHHPRPTAATGVLQLKAYVPGQYGFEAQPPALGPTFAVFLSTFGVAAYWWLVLVPSERRDLAKNKNKGGLNKYLDELVCLLRTCCVNGCDTLSVSVSDSVLCTTVLHRRFGAKAREMVLQ